MAAKRPRVPLNPVQGGLNAAFAGLEVEGLPAGDEPTAETARAPAPAQPGRVVLRREKAQRGGKTVVVIDGFAAHHGAGELEELARQLRTACGCGGTVRERTIEMQGDQPGRIRAALESRGFQVAGVR